MEQPNYQNKTQFLFSLKDVYLANDINNLSHWSINAYLFRQSKCMILSLFPFKTFFEEDDLDP